MTAMGAFFAYTLYSGVFLLLLYLLFRLFLSGEKQIALNRMVLIGCYVVSFAAWPLTHLEWHSVPVEPLESGMELDFSVIAANPAAAVIERPSLWPKVMLWVYLIGAVVVLVKTLYSIVRLSLYLRKGERIRKDGHTLIIMPGADTAPFSFGRFIVMSEGDFATVCDAVSVHEMAHIRCRHYLDLLLAQTVCVILWYNLASWLMRDELKLIHEYQADAEVLGSGTDEKEYQMLLIRKTFGNRFHTLANNLNHNKLKNRIAMMQKEKCSGRRRVRIFSLALAVGVALAVVNIPAVASGLSSLATVSLEVNTEMNAGDAADSVTAAEFPGGYGKMMEFLALNLRYPESAQSLKQQGLSVVRFTVGQDGSLSDVRILESAGSDLDDEAMRVVKKMPKWTPAISEGNPVESAFALPIRFILKDAEASTFIRVLGKENVTWLDEVQVVAYGAKPAAELEWESTKPVSPGTAPKAPYYVDGVLTDISKVAEFNPGEIESTDVYRPSAEYPEGRINIRLKQPHAYIDARNSNARLIVGPSGEKDGDNSAYEVVRVDGKILKESMAINIDDIESFNEVAPCDEYPNGLLDIKLKKK